MIVLLLHKPVARRETQLSVLCAASLGRTAPARQQGANGGAQYSRSAGDVTAPLAGFDLTTTHPAPGIFTVPVDRPAFLRTESTLDRSNSGSRPSYVSGFSNDGASWLASGMSGQGPAQPRPDASAGPNTGLGLSVKPPAGCACDAC